MRGKTLIGCAALAVAVYAASAARADVVGFWNFDNDAGISVFDSSGYGNDGTRLTNAALPNYVAGHGFGAGDMGLNFVGGSANTGPRVDLGNPVSMQVNGSRTTSYWVNLTALPSARYAPLGKSYSGIGTMNVDDDGQLQQYYGPQANGTAPNSGANVAHTTADGIMSAGTWIHVVHTRDSANSTREFFIDGLPLGSSTWSTYNPTAISTGPWLIGNGYTGAVNGVMDDVAIFDEPLSDGEIASLYKLDTDPAQDLMNLGIEVPELYELWEIHRAGSGSSAIVENNLWEYTDSINIAGRTLGDAWTVGPVTFLLLDVGSTSGVFFDSTIIPEPSSLMLLGLGCCGLLVRRRRRRRIALERAETGDVASFTAIDRSANAYQLQVVNSVTRRPCPRSLFTVLACLAVLTLLADPSIAPVGAVVIFEETFDTDTANTASTLLTYPAFTHSGAGSAIVNGGQLNLDGNAALFTIPGFVGEHFIDADYGATGVAAGSTQLRFRIGGVRTLFHPDYVPTPGAFRFELNVSLGNQDMGFVPASNVLHHIHIHAYGDGNFDLTITDGNNPLNTYTNSFFDPASVGQPIGFGYNSVGTGIFDNLIVDDGLAPIPEPSTTVLMGLGVFGLVRHIRRRRRR